MAEAPALLDADGKPVSEPKAVARAGLDLALSIDADLALDDACALTLLPAPGAGGGGVEEEALPALQATHLGPLNRDKPVYPANPVAWVSADWGAERPLTGLKLTLKTPADKTKLRVKIFTQGVWLPLTPTDILASGSEQHFTPVMAGKLMAELVEEYQANGQTIPGAWKPAPAIVASLALTAATLPGDLNLAIAGQPPLFRWAGLLPQAGLAVEGFAAAVNGYLAQPGASRPVPLKLGAGVAGKLTFKFEPAVIQLVRQWDAPADGLLRLSWQAENAAEATAHIDLKGENAQLCELSFTAEPDLPPARILGPVGADHTGKAQFCSPQYSLAQYFALGSSASVLIGMDLFLCLRSAGLAAELALHPDRDGQPGPQAYGGAVLPIAWPAATGPRAPDGWLSLDFPRPLQLPDPGCWAVLTLKDGEALCPLEKASDRAAACRYRQADAPWLPRADADGSPLCARIRLRLHAPEAQPALTLNARRGDKTVALTLDNAGQVRASAAALAQLNSATAATLTLQADARCAGQLAVRDLRLAYR